MSQAVQDTTVERNERGWKYVYIGGHKYRELKMYAVDYLSYEGNLSLKVKSFVGSPPTYVEVPVYDEMLDYVMFAQIIDNEFRYIGAVSVDTIKEKGRHKYDRVWAVDWDDITDDLVLPHELE